MTERMRCFQHVLCLVLLAGCTLAGCTEDTNFITSLPGRDAGRSGIDAAQVDKDAASGGSGNGANDASAASDGSTGNNSDSGSSNLDSGFLTDDDGGVLDVPTFVAVGYAGVRIVSYDLGLTWVERKQLGTDDVDDKNLLRGVTYAKGVFVALGHKLFTSTDGATWTRRTHPDDDAQWLGSVKYGNGRFVAVGGYGYTAYSTDGISWTRGGTIGTESVRTVAFGNGVFMARTGPENNWWQSTNGQAWALDSGGHTKDVQFCDGDFSDRPGCGDYTCGAGVCLKPGGWNTTVIKRSTDGGATFDDVNMPTPASLNTIAFGYTGGQP